MPLNAWDGRFAIECWKDADSEDEGQCEYGDDIEKLRQRADELIDAGHFAYIELTRHNAQTDEWEEVEVIEP